jgi:hypothetical protein
MSREAAIDLLQSVHLGQIACVRESQPYITPLQFAYQDHYIYSFATLGKRIEWMRANPLVCVEVERIESLNAEGIRARVFYALSSLVAD